MKDNKTGDNKALIIKPNATQTLNKNQQTFNRLIKKIENLRTKLKATSQVLDEKLGYYVKHIHPLEHKKAVHSKELVLLLFPFLQKKKFLSNKEHFMLKQLLRPMVDGVLLQDTSDEEIKKIFKVLNGSSYQEVVDQEFEEMKDNMEAMLESFGINVDLNDMNSNMSEEEIVRKIKQLEEQFLLDNENLDEKNASRRKSKKQLEREERQRLKEEVKNRNISSIYKQLAKVLHPDLEQDEERKIEKEELMKRLTGAYEKNDLHSLLLLELEWIYKEEQDAAKLTDDKLKIYNEVLREQSKELEEEIDMLYNHPRYEPLNHYTGWWEDACKTDYKKVKNNIEMVLQNMQKSIERLQTDEKIKEVKDIINIYTNSENTMQNFEY